jgi:magnesium chelatase family protein
VTSHFALTFGRENGHGSTISTAPKLESIGCGYFGDPKRECRCSPRQVENYRNRISGPLLDRIDIHVETPAVEFRDLSSDERAEPSEAIRERVVAARKIQAKRFASGKTRSNAGMSHAQLKTHRKLDSASQEMLRLAMTELQLSARAYDRILKVARTIADLAELSEIRGEHVAEAIQYRTLDRTLWR